MSDFEDYMRDDQNRAQVEGFCLSHPRLKEENGNLIGTIKSLSKTLQKMHDFGLYDGMTQNARELLDNKFNAAVCAVGELSDVAKNQLRYKAYEMLTARSAEWRAIISERQS